MITGAGVLEFITVLPDSSASYVYFCNLVVIARHIPQNKHKNAAPTRAPTVTPTLIGFVYRLMTSCSVTPGLTCDSIQYQFSSIRSLNALIAETANVATNVTRQIKKRKAIINVYLANLLATQDEACNLEALSSGMNLFSVFVIILAVRRARIPMSMMMKEVAIPKNAIPDDDHSKQTQPWKSPILTGTVESVSPANM